MANNQYGQPLRVDFLIGGVYTETLVWDSTASRWEGETNPSWRMAYGGGQGEGFVISDSDINPPKFADSTNAVGGATSANPIAYADGSLRADGKVGYKPVGSGTTATWYEIVAEGDASAGDGQGFPLGGQAGAQGDPHVTPIFGEKYSI